MSLHRQKKYQESKGDKLTHLLIKIKCQKGILIIVQ